MAKKTKSKKKPVTPRRVSPPRAASVADPTATRPAAKAAMATGTTAPGRRGVQRVDPAVQRAGAPARGRGADAGFSPLDPGDAAIPFDRVPYVPADLRRVAIMAAIMVVLIVVANLVISHLIG